MPSSSFVRRYNSPLVQVILLGLVCLCCPGMFNALSGLGAGGSMSSNVALTDAANGALYGCFAIVGFFAGSFTNTVGVKTTLTIGSVGYAIYSAAFWVYDRKQVSGFVIAAGAILGCCAGVFWSAQGSIMMSYPEEKNKGKYVAIFWSLFNIGGILGSVIALALNLENEAGGVSTGTYTAFVVIMIVGIFFSLSLSPPSRVVRPNGTQVAVAKSAHWTHELKGVLLLWKEWRMVALIPAFLASNWFYAYQFRVNAVYFSASARALNDTMYWALQIIGSLSIGFLLDYQGLGRRARGLVGLGVLFVVLMAVWAGGFAFQLTFDNSYNNPLGWKDSGFGGPFVLYMMYGLSDALYQTYLYWLMGAMSNDPSLLARYAGFYKAMQSAGAAISFGLDAVDIPLRWECLVCWLLVFVSFPLIFLVANKVTETNMSVDEIAAAEGVDGSDISDKHSNSFVEVSEGKPQYNLA
ncbi:major facilitator superfamily domain-containing protein [Radiomyces spectabilis]|uniref:major facilitator superfamily domain-containing protein n=1 Tax=Radiomyces spectabilis TaxID=64574 RepID=UPI00221FE064|nr:major facilitator superfamily domain-containing protein [Radiomyces spectabilis]KAI8388478.1 major facilitator superfamily domain-containing protein [Radiomyces spectabilis]